MSRAPRVSVSPGDIIASARRDGAYRSAAIPSSRGTSVAHNLFHHDAYHVEVADVTFVDPEGLGLLGAILRRGAALMGCSPFLDEMLREHRGGS